MTDTSTVPNEYAGLPEVLDADAVAGVFGISARVAARWFAEGRLPSRKVGKRRYITRAALLQALQPERPGPHRTGGA